MALDKSDLERYQRLQEFEIEVSLKVIKLARLSNMLLITIILAGLSGLYLLFFRQQVTSLSWVGFVSVTTAAILLLVYLRSARLATLFERMDISILKVLACRSIPAVVDEIDFDALTKTFIQIGGGDHAGERDLLGAAFLRPELPFQVKRLSHSFEAVYAKVPSELRDHRIPDFTNTPPGITLLSAQVDRLEHLTESLQNSAPADLPIFRGWQVVMVEINGRSVRGDDGFYRLLVGQVANLRIRISSNSPEDTIDETQPLEIAGTRSSESIAFQLEIRSAGSTTPEDQSTVLEWRKDARPLGTSLPLTFSAAQQSSVFLNTYYGSLLLQTTRVICHVEEN